MPETQAEQGLSREQLVAILMLGLMHIDTELGLEQSPMPIYASGALEIVKAAHQAVAEDRNKAPQ